MANLKLIEGGLKSGEKPPTISSLWTHKKPIKPPTEIMAKTELLSKSAEIMSKVLKNRQEFTAVDNVLHAKMNASQVAKDKTTFDATRNERVNLWNTNRKMLKQEGLNNVRNS